MRYFTADWHISHRKIIDHCHRPFATVEQMNETIINNVNSVVGRADILYILGDLSLGNQAAVTRIRNHIKCPQVHLIRGNHDNLSANQYQSAGFFFHGDMYEVKEGEQHITLCHYAMRRWNRSHHGSWQLFGHSHGHLPDDPSLFSFDVGVDCWSYFPVSYEQVQQKMASRTEAIAQQNHPKKDKIDADVKQSPS